MFARGFKSWCETVAVQQRRSLNLQTTDPLDARKLAQNLKVDVHIVEEIPGLDPQCLQVLLYGDGGSWSAVTISTEAKKLIILNSSHAQSRLASDLMHEIAHLLIGHDPARIDVTEDGSLMLNTYDKNQEEEANWLAGCLLLPRDALVFIRRKKMEMQAAARLYGISLGMLNYRMNVTGIKYQFKAV